MDWKQTLGWRQKVKWIRNNRQLAGWLGVIIGTAITLTSFILVDLHIKIPIAFSDKEVNIPAKIILALGAACLILGISRLRQQKKRKRNPLI